MKYLINCLILYVVLSCSQKKNTNVIPNIEEPIMSDKVKTYGIGGAWADGCNFSFEFGDDYLFAFESDFIKYKTINDSLIKIIYPNKPLIFKNCHLNSYEGSSFFSIGSMGSCIDVKKKVIIFGGDRLKYKLLNENKIKIYFPKESYWKISWISDDEMVIENKNDKIKYTIFKD